MARSNNYTTKFNKFIGSKIYNLRLAQGMSRTQLASAIDVTQQQLAKYEDGSNTVSVARLSLVAKALREDIGYFYKDFAGYQESPTKKHHQRMCIELSRNFMKIEDSRWQSAVNVLVKSLSGEAV